MKTTALLAPQAGDPLTPATIERRDLRDHDVDVRVAYCGVCHTDLHALDDPNGGFPLVPGHEFVGEVVAVGDSVVDFAPGDQVAVGNIVDSCGTCRMCLRGQENFCEHFPTLTYGGRDRIDGGTTQGAFAGRYVTKDRFVYHLPANLDPAAVAPLMCAGVTVWEPLRAAGVGAEVSVFTTSPAKAADARALGASDVVASRDPDAMNARRGTLDVIIDTVAVEHDLAPYIAALDLDGLIYSLGHLGPVTVQTLDLLVGRKRLSSAGSGGHGYTQDLLDFCGEHGITAEVEVVAVADVTAALDRLRSNDVRYRFVLDLRDIDG
jgi:uncharacterized zinc-type alcohol dehydrogenase-like protein